MTPPAPPPPTLANEQVKLRKWVQELLLPIDIPLKSHPPPLVSSCSCGTMRLSVRQKRLTGAPKWASQPRPGPEQLASPPLNGPQSPGEAEVRTSGPGSTARGAGGGDKNGGGVRWPSPSPKSRWVYIRLI